MLPDEMQKIGLPAIQWTIPMFLLHLLMLAVRIPVKLRQHYVAGNQKFDVGIKDAISLVNGLPWVEGLLFV